MSAASEHSTDNVCTSQTDGHIDTQTQIRTHRHRHHFNVHTVTDTDTHRQTHQRDDDKLTCSLSFMTETWTRVKHESKPLKAVPHQTQ